MGANVGSTVVAKEDNIVGRDVGSSVTDVEGSEGACVGALVGIEEGGRVGIDDGLCGLNISGKRVVVASEGVERKALSS